MSIAKWKLPRVPLRLSNLIVLAWTDAHHAYTGR